MSVSILIVGNVFFVTFCSGLTFFCSLKPLICQCHFFTLPLFPLILKISIRALALLNSVPFFLSSQQRNWASNIKTLSTSSFFILYDSSALVVGYSVCLLWNSDKMSICAYKLTCKDITLSGIGKISFLLENCFDSLFRVHTFIHISWYQLNEKRNILFLLY